MPFSDQDMSARDETLQRKEQLRVQGIERAARERLLFDEHFPYLSVQTATYLWRIACDLTDQLKQQYCEGQDDLRVRRLEEATTFNSFTWEETWRRHSKDDGTVLTEMARLYDDIGQTLTTDMLGRTKVEIMAHAPLPSPN